MDEKKVAQHLREMISNTSSILNSAEGPINAGSKTVKITSIVYIRDDASALRRQIRELAQMIGVEY